MKTDVSVVIVGAGLAGLVTAYELTRQGIDCLLLEAQSRIGGRVETITFADGVTAEAHMEEFWEASPAYALLHDLGLELDEDHAHSSLIIDGRLCVYRGDGDRDTYLAGLFDPGEREAFLAWNSFVEATLRGLAGAGNPAPDSTCRPGALMRTGLQSLVETLVPARRVAEWVRIVVEAETAVEWNQISALDGLAEFRPFLDSVVGFGERNAHVVGGNARFVEALASHLPADSLRTATRVTRVRALSDRAEVHLLDGEQHRQIVRCEQVVLTAPTWALRSIVLEPGLEPLAEHALETSRSGSYVKVVLRLRKEAQQLWAEHGPRLFTLLTDGPAGCVYLSEVPDGRDLVLTALVHGHHARRLNGLPQAEIVRRLLGGLESVTASASRSTGRRSQLFPGISRYVTDARAFDYPHAVAYWPLRLGRSRFDASAAALRRPHGRIFIGGDTTESSHSDGAVRSGQRIASVVARRLGVVEGATA